MEKIKEKAEIYKIGTRKPIRKSIEPKVSSLKKVSKVDLTLGRWFRNKIER